MQQFFLFCNMLIIASEAFSDELPGSQISTSVRRRTYKFAPRHKYLSPDMDCDLNFPMILVSFAKESPSSGAPYFVPVRQRAFKPKLERNYFSQNNWRFFSRKKRNKLSNKRKRSPIFSFEAPDSFFTDSPQCFQNYGLSGPQFRHVKPHRNFINSFENMLDSQSNVLIRNPNQYIVCFYPFIFNNLKKKTFSFLRKPKFSDLKRQYLINLRNIRFKNKRSANNVSAINEIVQRENKPEVPKSTNYQKNLHPKNESNSTYEIASVKERNRNLRSKNEENRTSVQKPVNLNINSFQDNETESPKKSTIEETEIHQEKSTQKSTLESPLKVKFDTYNDTNNSKEKPPLLYSFTDLYSNYLAVTQPTILLPRITFRYPYDINMYEPFLRTESRTLWEPMNKESFDVDEKNPESSSSLDKEKLKQMLEEVDWVLHDKSEGQRKSKKKKKKKKKKKRMRNENSDDMENSVSIKKKIDAAIPILTQISEELGKISNVSIRVSTTLPPPPPAKSSFFLTKSKRVLPLKSKTKKPDDRCTPDGTWTSSALGLELTVTMLPSMLLKVRITSKNKGLINENWSAHGLTLSKTGGPLMLAASYPKEKKIASFMGQCKICKDQDLIFGVWTIYSCVQKFTDLWKAVETKLDILKKKKKGR